MGLLRTFAFSWGRPAVSSGGPEDCEAPPQDPEGWLEFGLFGSSCLGLLKLSCAPTWLRTHTWVKILPAPLLGARWYIPRSSPPSAERLRKRCGWPHHAPWCGLSSLHGAEYPACTPGTSPSGLGLGVEEPPRRVWIGGGAPAHPSQDPWERALVLEEVSPTPSPAWAEALSEDR